MAKAFAERGVHYIALLDVADTQSAIAEVQAATKLHGGLKCVGFKADVTSLEQALLFSGATVSIIKLSK